jgi:polyphosphate kinase
MSTATALASVGDHGVLNTPLSGALSEVWIDRDLGWLDFNERVLAEALDERTPLLERAKFLAIFTSNLDEFFMKRMAVLRHAKERGGAGAGYRQDPREAASHAAPSGGVLRQTIVPELARHGIFLRNWDDLTAGQQEEGDRYFESSLSPALTPLVIDQAHPFPFLSNLSTSLTSCCATPRTASQCTRASRFRAC